MGGIDLRSDGRVLGRDPDAARSETVLSKGVSIDLHLSTFKPGHVATTVAAHVGIIL